MGLFQKEEKLCLIIEKYYEKYGTSGVRMEAMQHFFFLFHTTTLKCMNFT